MSAVSDINDLINCLNEALEDAAKHDRGNAAAGTRLRKCLSLVTKQCKGLRTKVQEEKAARKS